MIKFSRIFIYLFLAHSFFNANCMKMSGITKQSKQEIPQPKQTSMQLNIIRTVHCRQELIIDKTIDCIENYKDVYVLKKNAEIEQIGKQKTKKANGRAIASVKTDGKDKLRKKIYQFEKLEKLIINELELVRDYSGDYYGYLFPFLAKIEAGRILGGVCLTFSSRNSLDIFSEYIKSTIQDAPSMTDFVFYLEDLLKRIDQQRLYNIRDNIFESKTAEDTHKSEDGSLDHGIAEYDDLDMSIYLERADEDRSKKTENLVFGNDSFLAEEKEHITNKIIDENLVKFFSDWINENSKRYDVDGGTYKSGDLTFFNIICTLLLNEKIENSVAKKLSFAISPIVMCFLRAEIITGEDYDEFENQWMAILEHNYWNNVIQLLSPYVSNGTSSLEQDNKVCKEKIYSPITLTLSDSLIKVE